MQVRAFKGYTEAADISSVPLEFLTYPSKNVMVYKGKVMTRLGLVNDGIAPTGDYPIHSEFVWKDCIGGRRFIRVFGQTVQVKVGNNWHTIFDALDAGVSRVFFASWTDGNGAVIKKRLFFCDGSDNLYMWSGFVGTVESVAGGGTQLTVVADKTTLALMGADAGDVTAQTVNVYDMASGAISAQEEETYSNDPTAGLVITLASAPSFGPAAGDIVIAKPIAYANAIASGTNIDVITSYQNHLVAASYDRVDMHFSHRETFTLAAGLNFTQPAAGSRTALTAIHLYLDAPFMAMMGKKNVLWVSDADDWYKVTKTVEQNAYDLWTDVEKFENGELKGALPMAVAKHKGDIIYMSQDGRIQRITTIDLIGKDDILLLSDDVQAMLDRYDHTDVRLYYIERGIYIIFPTEGILVILDTSENQWFFQPPQEIPIRCMSIHEGIKYGHHNARNETYILFSGRDDLGSARAQSVIALGYQRNAKDFIYKKTGILGMDCRLTDSTEVVWEREYEEESAKGKGSDTFLGKDLKKFTGASDGSWAANPYASVPFGGEDISQDLMRAFVFTNDGNSLDGFFEQRPILTIGGLNSEFHLLGLSWEELTCSRKIGSELFIAK